MALTVKDNGTADGGKSIQIRTGSFSCDNSYATGGYAIDLSAIGIRSIHHLVCENKGGYDFSFDRTNQKVVARASGAANTPENEVLNATDLSAVTDVGFVAFGQP